MKECLQSISEKYPWSQSKFKMMVTLSFLTQVVRGTFFYGLDIYTDIQFTLDMYRQANRNFAADFVNCKAAFDQHFDFAIENCKMSFDKSECSKSIAQVYLVRTRRNILGCPTKYELERVLKELLEDLCNNNLL